MLTYFSDLKPDAPHYRFIQYLAARGFRPSGDTFQPAAPTTRGELARWLTLLVERSAPEPKVVARGADGRRVVERGFAPYMGMPANREALRKLEGAPGQDAVVSRAEVAGWIAAILPPIGDPAGPAAPRYSDLTDAGQIHAAALLANRGTDSTLWDGWSAYAPDGSLLFRPAEPLRHDAMFATLYVAQIGLGPAFCDHPLDGGKGRAVQPALMEWVTIQP
jgi:hypothetical protein